MGAVEQGDDITVVLVDDHGIVRTGLRAYLDTEPGVSVVAEAADGLEALARIDALAREGRVPDVVLMDMQMPRLDGVEATGRIKERWPEIDVIAVTSFVEEARIRAALEAGATGYLLKDADADDVVDAIRGAVAGEIRLDPAVATALALSLRTPASSAAALTPRERRGDHAGRRGTHEPRDRPAPGRRGAHRPDARVQHPDQARARIADPGGDVGGA